MPKQYKDIKCVVRYQPDRPIYLDESAGDVLTITYDGLFPRNWYVKNAAGEEIEAGYFKACSN